MKTRRTGSITLGLMLVVFGTLFLLRYAIPTLTFAVVLKFWPLLFILLGVEILLGYIFDKDGTFRYDTGAIIMMAFLLLFAMCMGGLEWFVEHAPNVMTYELLF